MPDLNAKYVQWLQDEVEPNIDLVCEILSHELGKFDRGYTSVSAPGNPIVRDILELAAEKMVEMFRTARWQEERIEELKKRVEDLLDNFKIVSCPHCSKRFTMVINPSATLTEE